MQAVKIGIIGGSGLYAMPDLENLQEHRIETPFGFPSDLIMTGLLNNIPVAFLARHGQDHHLLPSEVPYQANIYAFKQLGVGYLLSFSAVGSLQKAIKPLDMLLPDQYLDLTRQRPSTFMGNGVVGHVSMADPVCTALSAILAKAVNSLDDPPVLHQGGTYLCIEGPQFSTRVESCWYRSLGASVVGMTNMPEARLAREAQIAYASLAMVTDYDSWNPDEAGVTAEMAIANLRCNAERATLIAREAIRLIDQKLPVSSAHRALEQGLVTPLDKLTPDKRALVELLLKKDE